MLQQTQVDRVAEKFPVFIKRFPSIKALACAEFSDVMLHWQGLGYNRRARFLHEAAKAIVDSYKGRIPSTPDELLGLPGIGPNTAASIAAFGFGFPAVFIETNIRSVIIHHFFPGREKVSDAQIIPLVEETLDRDDPYAWYSAMMDYGTHLKSIHGNPSRRSSHHVRQSKFEGSDRQVRGRLMRALTMGSLDADALFSSAGEGCDRERFDRIVMKLCKDGMIRMCNGVYAV
jgi:A/G-specific adenine glycosylase